MGTNFYMMTKDKELIERYAPYSYKLTDIPDWGYSIHVAKTSCGWLPLFQAHENGIKSIRGYKEAFDTGDFTIYDEYGDTYSWKEFDERVLQHNGGKVGVIKPEKVKPPTKKQKELFGDCIDHSMPEYTPVSHIPGTKQSYKYSSTFYTTRLSKDEDGYEFDREEFS